VAGLALGALREDEREQGEADPLDLIGKQVRRYAIKAYLGGGGMGVVYRARDTKLDRTVALKFLPPHLSAHPEAKERLLREARTASALDHPNIGTIHEISETKEAAGRVSAGQRYIAMTYYAGETLKAKIARGPLPTEEAVGYAIQIAEGLCKAHEAGVVHRDVKPANVIVTEAGQVKLVDFGLARAAGESALTRAGQMLGTAAYMSPEQARGESVDERTDLWSLGAVLYEMLTGRRPFRGRRLEAIIYSILNETPESLTSLRPEVHRALASVVEGCLAKDLEKRYPDAETLLQALRAGRSATEEDSFDRGWLSEVWPRPVVQRWGVRVAAAVGLILIVSVGWALWPMGPAPIDSITVLPLTSPSDNAEDEYFTYGMTEALTAELGQIGALRVISRSSAMQYEDADTPLPEIARELGVDALVQGSVFQSDGRVRITVRLVQGSSGEQLWSESFEREYQDVLTLQREVARAVAGEVQVALDPEEEARLANTRPVHPEAHRQWLIGNYYLTLQDEATFRKALDAYQEAIDIDPGYAHAYAGMALAYAELGGWHASIPPEDVFPQAEAAARQALALDSTVAEAHIALARVQWMYRWDWADADRVFRRGIALNPSSTPARLYYEGYLRTMRRFEEAIVFGRETLTLDPLSPVAHSSLAFSLMFAGREADALALSKRRWSSPNTGSSMSCLHCSTHEAINPKRCSPI
jgi:serine/threonine-protein kinase